MMRKFDFISPPSNLVPLKFSLMADFTFTHQENSKTHAGVFGAKGGREDGKYC